MIVHLRRTRMATAIPSYSYDAEVPLTDAPLHAKENVRHFTVRDSVYYISLADAITPPAHYELPLGWDRYEDAQTYSRLADALATDLFRANFPELAPVPTDRLVSSLWEELPDSPELPHASITVDTSKGASA